MQMEKQKELWGFQSAMVVFKGGRIREYKATQPIHPRKIVLTFFTSVIKIILVLSAKGGLKEWSEIEDVLHLALTCATTRTGKVLLFLSGCNLPHRLWAEPHAGAVSVHYSSCDAFETH